jgi:large subunit ribosomal protein L35Ae
MVFEFSNNKINNCARGVILGFKRSLRHQNVSRVRIKIINTKNNINSSFFIGKKIIYIRKNTIHKRKKIIWGKIISLHGKSGVFIAKFLKNLPPSSMNDQIHVTSFPFNQKKTK